MAGHEEEAAMVKRKKGVPAARKKTGGCSARATVAQQRHGGGPAAVAASGEQRVHRGERACRGAGEFHAKSKQRGWHWIHNQFRILNHPQSHLGAVWINSGNVNVNGIKTSAIHYSAKGLQCKGYRHFGWMC